MPEPHVLIIGAGLTGLLIAHGLNKINVPYTIFESEEAGTLRRREWTMGVHWGVPLMEKLLPEDLAKRLVSEATVDKTLDYGTEPCNGSKIYDGVSGRVLKELKSEGKLLRVSRRKLRKLISEGVDIKFKHVLKAITQEEGGLIEAVFENGLKYPGTLIVGADGPRSATRAFLFDGSEEAEVKPLDGIVHLSTTFSYGDAEKSKFVRTAHPVWSMMIHPEIFTYLCMQDAPDPDKPEDWVYFLFVCWVGEKPTHLSLQEVKKLAQEKGSKIGEPFRSAIQWIPEDVELLYSDVSYWVAQDWDTRGGRVTLAGDSAHPMPPYRGQGLNHAIQDATNFVEMVGRIREDGEKQEELVRGYSAEVVERGGEETRLSMKNAYMALAYDDFKESPYMKHGLSKQ